MVLNCGRGYAANLDTTEKFGCNFGCDGVTDTSKK